MRRIRLASVLLLAAVASPLRAQNIGDDLSVLTLENAQGYAGPLARGLGHALTAGLVSSGDPHGMLGFSVGVRVVGSLFTDDDETFAIAAPPSVTYGSQTYNNPYGPSGALSPTVAGEGNGVLLTRQGQFLTALVLADQNPNEFNIQFPEGRDLPIAPFAVIDAALGVGFGTQLMARIIPTIDVGNMVGADEVGSVSAFGIGIMHDLTQWLPIPTPFWGLSVTAGTQKVNLGDYFEASGNTIGLVGSAGLGPLSVYIQPSSYESTVDLDYTIANPDDNPALPPDGTRIAFEEVVERTTRVALGAQLDLILLKLSAEYGMGDYNTVSGRVAFGFH